MKKRLLIGTLSTVMSLGFLSGCNKDNNNMNDTRDVNYSPVRYNEMDDDINRGNVRPRVLNENNGNRNNADFRNNGRNNTSPVRFDRDGGRDRMDRDGILDVNENNRNGRIFDNDGGLNDNVNLRRGNDNTGTQQGGGGMFRGR